MRLRIRRRAKKELLDIDDDAVFFAVVRAILGLETNPRLDFVARFVTATAS